MAKKTLSESLAILQEQLVEAESIGDTRRAKLLKIMITRLSNLKPHFGTFREPNVRQSSKRNKRKKDHSDDE